MSTRQEQHRPQLNSRAPLRLRILSDPANLAAARKAVEDLALAHGFDASACGEIALCVNEALANVMRHAYGGATDRPIELDAAVREDDRALHLRIRDWGSGVNPDDLPAKPKDPMTPGGLGLICLRKMMDEVRFTPQPDGMLLEMTRSKQRRQSR
jgi:anti-sigma regulatory factor (Ser/Thr protein kinase)